MSFKTLPIGGPWRFDIDFAARAAEVGATGITSADFTIIPADDGIAVSAEGDEGLLCWVEIAAERPGLFATVRCDVIYDNGLADTQSFDVRSTASDSL
jgi:hypothetical protein